MSNKLVIWGASGHARVVADIIQLRCEFEIVGFLDDLDPHAQGREFCGLPVLGGRERLPGLRAQGVSHAMLGFGNCAARLRLGALLRSEGFELATAVHPAATVARDVEVGGGSVVAAGAVINPAAVIGENVIVNTNAGVDHECVIASGAHICPGVRLAGKVSVGEAAWVGIGSTVIEGITIGAGALIGAGSLVLGDIPAGMVAYGVPAKITKRVDA
jgi:UDP-N-acetylbacillosamine N-acetyltransferase